MLSSPILGARLITASLLLGSVASCGAAATETCTPVSPAGFKSRVIPQFYTSDQLNCLNKYGPLNPNGKRPACAVTSWNSATHLCSIIGVKPGCACYEGQAHACDLGAAGSPASPCTSGTNCGVVTCNVVSDTSSTWNGCTELCSCSEGAMATTSSTAPASATAVTTAPVAPAPAPAPEAAPSVAPAPAPSATPAPAPVP
jgi:hypothetical protein